jgi:hypothetical protein
MSERYLNRGEAADYLTDRGLRISKLTLQKMATIGGGPEYQIFGNRAVYLSSRLDTWADARLGPPCSSSSDATEAA